jgi:hypothetical protein
MKQHIHTWALVMDWRSLFEVYQIPCATFMQQHVPLSWGDEYHARDYGVMVSCFSYFQLTHLVEPAGEGGGEVLRHMLHDYRARHRPGQSPQHGFNGPGASSRRPNSQNFVRRLKVRRRL